MANLLRMLFTVAMVVVVVLAAALQQPESARDVGLEPQTALALRDQLFGNFLQDRKDYERNQAISRRFRAKEKISKDVIDGQTTLFEAAIEFRRLNNEYPALPDDPQWLGDSEEERLCRQVIMWVGLALKMHPGAGSEDIVDRLEQELRCNKEWYGSVRLP
jgi:hypothetical protein